MESFWPEDIVNKEGPRHPLEILREQGKLLGNATKNVIYGEARKTITAVSDPKFVYSFSIVAPTIKYQFVIFSIEYTIDAYPVTIKNIDSDIAKEIDQKMISLEKIVSEKEADFMLALKLIFGSKKVKNLVKTLLIHVKE